MRWRLATSGLLMLVLGVATGCWPFSGTDTAMPEAVVQAYQVETRLWAAYGKDSDAYVKALIQDIEALDPEADGAAYRAKWAELRQNYEDAMRVRAVIASWMDVLDAFLEVAHAGE